MCAVFSLALTIKCSRWWYNSGECLHWEAQAYYSTQCLTFYTHTHTLMQTRYGQTCLESPFQDTTQYVTTPAWTQLTWGNLRDQWSVKRSSPLSGCFLSSWQTIALLTSLICKSNQMLISPGLISNAFQPCSLLLPFFQNQVGDVCFYADFLLSHVWQ